MKMKTLTLVAACALFTTPAAAGKKTNAGDKAEAATGTAVTQLTLAQQLADLSIERKDAIGLVTAARIMMEIPTEEGTAIAEGAEEGKGTTDEKKDSGTVMSAETMLEKATELAGQDVIALAMIQASSAVSTRGDISGPNRHEDVVRANATDTYRVVFQGSVGAEVAIDGDGDTDLDLYIYDEGGNEICRSTSSNDVEYCSWTPAWTGPFEIKVRNLGSIYNRYIIYTN